MNWAFGDVTPDAIERDVDAHIDKYRAAFDRLGAIDAKDVGVDNVLRRLIALDRDMTTEEHPLEFAQQCAVDKSVREASLKATQRLDDFGVEIRMRKDVFDNLVALGEKRDLLDSLTAEERRFFDKEIIAGRRNGLHLPEDTRNKVKDVKKNIAKLATKFNANMNEDTSFVEIDEVDLAGVPDDLVKTFERTASGKCKVTMKYPHFFPVSRKCRVPETRRKVEVAYQSKCMAENTPILEEIIRLRQEQAQLLGYKNHAAYVQELRMAKNPETVAEFLSDLATKLKPLWTAESDEMLRIKKEECEKFGYEFNGKLDFWDARYYMNKVEELKYSVDQEKLKEFFPLDTVTKGLFAIYQDLLGLKFVQMENANAWFEDVQLFRVDDVKSGETLGYFFLDLHPREGKYGHYAIFNLQPSCLDDSREKRQVGVCAMMCNFTKPTADKPALLQHGEVETYFHEFGHVMHMLCSKTETAKFGGTHVERDFVEAPSQMLENWVWEEEALKKMSGHYKDASEIPRELLDKLTASRKANAGGFNLRQIVLATFDQRIHCVSDAESAAKVDTQRLFSDIYKDIVGLSPIENTNMPASWGHMVGYDAQYYGYLWSEVYSYDMFESRFRKEGLLNAAVGADYRAKILQPGGTKDAIDLLRDFLGREPSKAAFLKAKGLSE